MTTMTDDIDIIEADDRPSKRVKLSPSRDDNIVNEAGNGQTEQFDGNLKNSPQENEVTKKERDVGITAYVSDRQPVLIGLLKKRYTDFLVNEVTRNGRVLHLTSLRAFKVGSHDNEAAEESTPDNGKDAADDGEKGGNEATATKAQASEAAPTPAEISPEDRAKLSEHFAGDTVTQILGLYSSVISNPKAKPSEHPTVRTPFTTDRTLRGAIHQELRRIFSSRIESQTDHSGTLVLSAAQPSRPNNNKSSRSKQNKRSWAERGGEHLHFNLYKENRDTMEMVNLLARLMKINSKDLKIAGTKDRRAATVQRVSVYRVDSERLVGLNKTLRGAALGDFDYKTQGLELGELSGNEFEIALRECQVDGEGNLEQLKDKLMTSLSELHERGFVNYYGLQRFGTFGIRTDEIGARILEEDFEGACNMILDFNPQVLEATEDGTESTVGRDDKLRAEGIDIWRKGGKINDALDKMPKRFAAETMLIRHLGKKQSDFLGALLAIPRTQRTLYAHAYQSRVWNMAASERWKLFGDKIVEGDLVLVHEHKDKEAPETQPDSVDADGEVVIQASAADSSRTVDDIFERARHLTAGEVASGMYNIFDIVLPTPGWDIEYPKNESGDFYKTFMASEEGGQLDPQDMRRKQRDFSLSGSYRKVMARIGKDFNVDIRTYAEEDETLLQTDFEKLRHRGAGGNANQEEMKANGEGNEEQSKLAIVLTFQLASSQYATMALRELSRGGVREYKPDFSGGR